jgi:hypothetical protein
MPSAVFLSSIHRSVSTSSECLLLTHVTNICMNGQAMKLEGYVRKCAGVGIETASQRCEGGGGSSIN